jgi:putative peptide zinc metalloprotease protein
MERARAQLARSQQRVGELTVRSPIDGVFILEQPQNAPGRYVQRGDQMAYVMDFSAVTVRVVVPQGDVDRVAKATRAVELRPVERVAEVVSATIKKAVPAATNDLPSRALSLQGGGTIGLDPTRPQDPGKSGDAKSAVSLFVFDLQLASTARVWTLGNRVHVRFEHQAEPLAAQMYRTVRRLFLKKFNV